MSRPRSWIIVCALPVLLACQEGKKSLQPGAISSSVTFSNTYQRVNLSVLSDSVYLHIHGDDLVIDFSHCVLDARQSGQLPNTFSGVAIRITDSRNVTISNLSVHGFKIAILAERVENLKLLNCNLSYNYRPKLYSKWDRESLSDWLYFHHNEEDEWMRYGAAIYLKDCDRALVRDIVCHQGMNGLLMTGCNDGLVYNNDLSFNSGLGIGLYRSSHNKIMHNRLDWNARGYSHGKYARGQDSAGILLYEQSSQNTIAYNSATHSGDGLFLWAGQQTMDTGLGGCDSNMIYRNDFSHSIANGVEATFSINYIIDNILNDCRYGVWGGYSHHSVIMDNEIDGCDYGIAIEHGNHNVIDGNRIRKCPVGIQLWQRNTQPPDWPYAQVRDVRSRDYSILRNQFIQVGTALEVSATDSVYVSDNVFDRVKKEFDAPLGPSQILKMARKTSWFSIRLHLPDPMDDGMDVGLPDNMPAGRQYIIVNAWGPYDFKYPRLVLRDRKHENDREVLYFMIFGPPGNWVVDSIRGYELKGPGAGSVPDSIDVYTEDNNPDAYLRLSFVGDTCITQFGDTIPAGTRCYFDFRDPKIPMDWTVTYFPYDSTEDPVKHPGAFSTLLKGPPAVTEHYNALAFHWWGNPVDEIPADQFAVSASADISVGQGDYTLQVESDDGIRLWLDDQLLLQRWDIHTPEIDEVPVALSAGKHVLRLEYFEAGGLGVLDVSLIPR